MKKLFLLFVSFAGLLMLAGLSSCARIETRKPKCCQIDVPSKPIFTDTGDFLYYQPQPCPDKYLICCKSEINISGTCIDLQTASAYMPIWQSVAQTLGISLLEAIQQSGVLVG